MKSISTYIRTRLPAVITIVTISALVVMGTSDFCDDAPLHQQLTKATGLSISPDSVQWIERFDQAGIHTATNFHEVAFLASRPREKYRDLYIARIKIVPPRNIIEVSPPVNLTASDAGDDYQFRVQGSRIVVATRVLGQVRSLTVFNLSGAPIPEDDTWTPGQRTLARVTDYQKTGRWKGISKTTIRFHNPARQVDFEIGVAQNRLMLGLEWMDSTQASHTATVDLAKMSTQSEDIQVLKEMRLPKKPVLWMVDSVRELEWIGPGPIEWAEGRFFAMKDRLNQFKYAIAGDSATNAPDDTFISKSKEVAIRLPEGTEVGDYDQLVWPPRPLKPPVFAKQQQGEGEWVPAEPDFMKALPNAPPSIYKTYIRSDRQRPYTHVKLYAIDTRQLQLHMVGGHEDPISTTGEVGTGQLPRDRETVENIALVFNGAFKTIHGEYGMMADRAVLLPPKDEAATVATDSQGRTALGSWPKGAPIPDSMVSFRQNMDPLLENGVINPKKRYLWGFTLGSDISQMNTIRSGLCIRDDGLLVYAWGDDLTADTLGVAMRAAECTYGIHLDMNPFHTSFVAFQMTWRGEDTVPKFEYRRLIRDIRFWPDRYVHGAPKDFFYMTLRQTTPPGEDWQSDHITQPAPAFLPSIFRKTEADVALVAIDTVAVRPTLLPGAVPVAAADGTDPGDTVPLPEDLGMVVEVLLGKWSSTRGQMTDGTVVASLKTDEATLYLDAADRLRIGPWSEGHIQTTEAIQGAWLIRNGEERRLPGNVMAICQKDNWLFLAKGPASAVAASLIRMGVQTAAAIDDSEGDILIRSNGLMKTIAGESRQSRDVSIAALRFSAAQRPAFGTRLEQFFTLQEAR
ncbi:MAG: hypothetical protein JXX14_22025 [Deltaproteobacteria bacterium]|nr:hypothetical protein [Deltaproteobacteria bacterium]